MGLVNLGRAGVKVSRIRPGLHDLRRQFAVVDRVGEIAAKRGVSNAQVAPAWLLHQPGVTAPIVGAW